MKFRLEWTETTDYIRLEMNDRIRQRLQERWMFVECDSVATAEQIGRTHVATRNRCGVTATFPSVVIWSSDDNIDLDRELSWEQVFQESEWEIAHRARLAE